MTETFIVTSLLWRRPIKVTVESGPYAKLDAVRDATRLTVWTAEEWDRVARILSGSGEPVSFEDAIGERMATP